MADPPTGTPPTGIAMPLEPLVTRILAPNPSPYTFTGTQSYVVGTREVAVIDPGPDDPAHLAALEQAIAGRRVVAILVTHHHRDHTPASRPLARATGAPIVGAAALVRGGPSRSFDADYAPDRVLAEDDAVAGNGWTLRAVATPGHSSRHLAFALPETGALFSGDHVMGWSTSIVSPPDGDMGEYMASLEKLQHRDDRVYYPGHGEAVANPARLVRGMIGHRRQREGQIMRLLAGGALDGPAMTRRMYAGLSDALLPAAERSVLAHLIDLERRGMVEHEEDRWAVTPPR
ncbi:MAG: MBL fold metallo-hydrolase [Janthinobacterium lividum]